MKNLFFAVVVLVALPASGKIAQADEIKVEVTSFRFAGSRNYTAEICGKVTSEEAQPPLLAKIQVDPKEKNPGTYYAIIGAEKKFCAAVVTYSGTADVTAQKFSTGENLSSITSSKVAQ